MASLLSVYRVAQSKYIRDLTGTGAKLYGGRWNRPGLPVLYTSQARSLALLELIVHFNSKKAFKNKYEFVHLQIPSKDIIDTTDMVEYRYFTEANSEQLWSITDRHFGEESALCIKVPSVLVPGEYNYIINPEAREFQNIEVMGYQDAFIDTRYVGLY